MTDIFNNTDIAKAIEDLIGKGNMQPVKGVQIAPRFPLLPDQEPEPYFGIWMALGEGAMAWPRGCTYEVSLSLPWSTWLMCLNQKAATLLSGPIPTSNLRSTFDELATK